MENQEQALTSFLTSTPDSYDDASAEITPLESSS